MLKWSVKVRNFLGATDYIIANDDGVLIAVLDSKSVAGRIAAAHNAAIDMVCA